MDFDVRAQHVLLLGLVSIENTVLTSATISKDYALLEIVLVASAATHSLFVRVVLGLDTIINVVPCVAALNFYKGVIFADCGAGKYAILYDDESKEENVLRANIKSTFLPDHRYLCCCYVDFSFVCIPEAAPCLSDASLSC
eukprot:6207094-Pleurochrysis_carterae.AAC.1